MQSDRDAFLAAIAADPLDCQLRAIYADWLDDHGLDPDESARQRRWPEIMEESGKWLTKFAENEGLSREAIIEAANDYLDHGSYLCDGGRWEGSYVPDKFWDHFAIVTGRSVSERSRGSFFSCAC